MAAPKEKTLRDLSGKWILNKSLSDDFDRTLQLQSIGWLIRQALRVATVTLTCTQYVDSESKTHIDIAQVVTGGIHGSNENRILDYTWREQTNSFFGKVKGRTRFCKLDEVEYDDWLKTGWMEEQPEGEFIESYVESLEYGWIADQVWGFQEVSGERRHVRKVVVKKGQEEEKARFVYDYLGSDTAAEQDDGLAYE